VQILTAAAYVPGFSVKCFLQPIYTKYANYECLDKKITLKSPLKSKLNQTWLDCVH